MDGTIGTVVMFGPSFPPKNWAFCQGQTLAISDYTALFSVIGATFGGDARSTFGLPDMRGRTAVGVGAGPGLIPVLPGSRYGLDYNRLTVDQLPNHHHENTLTVDASPVQVDVAVPVFNGDGTAKKVAQNNCNLAKITSNNGAMYNNTDTAENTLAPFTATGSAVPQVTITNAGVGSGNPVENRQPSSAINYVICLEGLYPSRN